MVIYLGTFALSVGLTAYGENLRKKKNQKGFVLCIMLAVVAVVTLAAFRDVRVGTDGVAYQRWVRNASSCSDFAEAVKVGRETEPAFMLLVYFVAKLFGNVQVLFALNAFFTYGLCMIGLLCLQEKLSLPYAWAAYLFLFYGYSFNALRQSVAMTAVIFAFALLKKKKYIGCLCVLGIATLCHNITAVLAILIFGIYFILKKWNLLWIKAAVLLCTAVAVFFYKPLFYLMNRIGVLPDRFSWYLVNDGSFHFSLNPILVRLPFLLLVLIFYHDFVGEKEQRAVGFTKADADFLVMMMGMEIILSELRVISFPLYRICLYFGVFRCLGIGRLVRALEESPENQRWTKPVKAALLGMLVVIWLYQVVLQGNDEIYPYTSELLRIGADTFF